MKSSVRLQSSVLSRVARSILLVVVLIALGVVGVVRYQERHPPHAGTERTLPPPTPGTERARPPALHHIDALA